MREPLRRGFPLHRRPESLQGYAAQVVLRRLSDAEMGIDLRGHWLGGSHLRLACPVVAPWVRKKIEVVISQLKQAMLKP